MLNPHHSAGRHLRILPSARTHTLPSAAKVPGQRVVLALQQHGQQRRSDSSLRGKGASGIGVLEPPGVDTGTATAAGYRGATSDRLTRGPPP
jgi:hypothetical protein